MRSVRMQSLTEKLEKSMEQERDLILQFSLWERDLNQHVCKRDWKKLQKVMASAEALSDELDKQEQMRCEVFAQLRDAVGELPDAGFYQVAVHLPAEERERLSALFRELKMAVVNLRGIVWGIDAYVRAVQGTLKGIIGEMSPMRRGTIYAKNGGARQSEAGPLILNRQL